MTSGDFLAFLSLSYTATFICFSFLFLHFPFHCVCVFSVGVGRFIAPPQYLLPNTCLSLSLATCDVLNSSHGNGWSDNILARQLRSSAGPGSGVIHHTRGRNNILGPRWGCASRHRMANCVVLVRPSFFYRGHLYGCIPLIRRALGGGLLLDVVVALFYPYGEFFNVISLVCIALGWSFDKDLSKPFTKLNMLRVSKPMNIFEPFFGYIFKCYIYL